jgi:phosphoglycerate kinase
VLLLENLRFYGGETENDDAFAKQLSTLADVYVNDAFGTMHRAHASIVGVPKYLKERGIGLLAARELENLRRLTDKPARPYVAILGGAKVKDKLAVLLNLMGTVDTILVGGAMALTFLAAEGKRLGSSRVELESVGLAEKVLRKAAASNVELLLPVDHIAADRVEHEAHHEAADNDRFPDGRFAVDIGPRTIELFQSRIERAKSVFWNGPMGVFEVEPFNRGTVLLGKAVARSSAFSVVGGGDSVSAIRKGGVAPFISHVSTGGGASLDFIEGKTMPGLAALSEE